jgi:hypothetical protein
MKWVLVVACVLATNCYRRTHHPYYASGPPTESGQVLPENEPRNCTTANDGQVRCADGYAGYPQGYPAGYVGDGYPSGYTRGETCLVGSNGVVACGHDCKVGTAGIAACSNVPGGSCASGSDGLVYCQSGR